MIPAGVRIQPAHWKLLAVAACWGASWLAGRVVAGAHVDPVAAAALRFLFGCVGLGIAAAMQPRMEWPPTRAWLPITLMGVTGIFLYNICFFHGLRFVPAGRGSLIVSAQPALIYLLMVASGRESIRWTRVAGIFVALGGAAIVLAEGNPVKLFAGGVSRGDFVIAGCMLSWIAYTLLGRWAMQFASPLVVTVCSTLVGTILLLLASLVTGTLRSSIQGGMSAAVWFSLGFLGFFATALAFLWYLDGVRAIGPSSASVFLNLVPVFGVALSTVFLGEPLSLFTIGGGLLVMGGVRLLNRKAP